MQTKSQSVASRIAQLSNALAEDRIPRKFLHEIALASKSWFATVVVAADSVNFWGCCKLGDDYQYSPIELSELSAKRLGIVANKYE